MANIQIKGLVPGKSYDVQIRAKDGASYSDWSNKFTFTADADTTAPSTPSAAKVLISSASTDYQNTLTARVKINGKTNASQVIETDTSYFEVYASSVNTSISATKIGDVSYVRVDGVNSEATLTVPLSGSAAVVTPNNVLTSLYFFIRAVDRSGNKSPFSAGVLPETTTYFANAYISDLSADKIVTGTLQANQQISVGSTTPIVLKSNSTAPVAQLYNGTGNFSNNDTPFYLDSDYKFSLGDKFIFSGSGVNATASIGGWTITASSLYTGSGTSYVEISSSGNTAFKAGDTSINLINNSTFEYNYSGWIKNSSTTTIAVISTDSYNGSKSLEVTQAASVNCGASYYKGVSVIGNTSYTLSAWVKVPSGNATASIACALAYYDLNGNQIGSSVTAGTPISTTSANSTSWLRVSYTATTPSNAVSAKPYIINTISSTAGQKFLIDAVMMEPGSTLNTFTTGAPLFFTKYGGGTITGKIQTANTGQRIEIDGVSNAWSNPNAISNATSTIHFYTNSSGELSNGKIYSSYDDGINSFTQLVIEGPNSTSNRVNSIFLDSDAVTPENSISIYSDKIYLVTGSLSSPSGSGYFSNILNYSNAAGSYIDIEAFTLSGSGGTTVARLQINNAGGVGSVLVTGTMFDTNNITWTAASLSASWSNSLATTYTNASYKKYPDGTVALRGVVQRSASAAGGSSGATIFILPAGYLPPSADRHVFICYDSTNGYARVDVFPTGSVQVQTNVSAGAFISLDGIRFDTNS